MELANLDDLTTSASGLAESNLSRKLSTTGSAFSASARLRAASTVSDGFGAPRIRAITGWSASSGASHDSSYVRVMP